MSARAFLSSAIVTAVCITCKAFLNSGLCSVKVNGLQILKDALRSRQGVLTVCNHISTLDDPMTWGVLPARWYLSSRTTRWALGASEVIFTNPVFSAFFSLGQTLETFRGKGIYQPAVDTAIQKLNEGRWVHLYSESKVNQPDTYFRDKQGVAHLPRLKWGVGRILMEVNTTPVVIPMWISGFDQLMPEGRAFPYKYLPRIGARLTVTFGEPVPAHELKKALSLKKPPRRNGTTKARSGVEQVIAPSVRKEVTAVIHRHVEGLGRSISGKLLTDTSENL
ncbi:hypothetical protein GALMADRAFT_109958 [Galerina marginata CBS 339.88]|uniref:Tafazzin family protein n=1 Tax=Galerina marginata (strain CBS 339.88) TaxID=685588 RepID=A0A067TMC9_GALM3|nr:hypothetical protein GALMADRAFT_109958 [Galerina marginata CBS 339.88]